MTSNASICAWLVTGNPAYPDMPCLSERDAINCVFVRNDGKSYAVPLVDATLSNDLYRALANSQATMSVLLRAKHDPVAFNLLTKRLAAQVELNAALFARFNPSRPVTVPLLEDCGLKPERMHLYSILNAILAEKSNHDHVERAKTACSVHDDAETYADHKQPLESLQTLINLLAVIRDTGAASKSD